MMPEIFHLSMVIIIFGLIMASYAYVRFILHIMDSERLPISLEDRLMSVSFVLVAIWWILCSDLTDILRQLFYWSLRSMGLHAIDALAPEEA